MKLTEIMNAEETNQRPSSPGVNQLMVGCQQGNEVEVAKILAKKPELVNQKDKTGKCALHYCAENKTTSCASALLELSPELIGCQDEEGYSTLHLAVISGNKKMAKFLLAQGADPNCRDSENHSCVHWATVCGEVDCLEMLLNGGADPSTPDIHGAFPIHYAAQMCGPNSEMGNDVRVGLFVLRKLLDSGVDVNCRDQDGRQPLLWAASTETRASKTYCTSGSGDAILALVNAGASVCSVDKDGLTALHCGASRGHVECLDTLITLCGAEVDFMDNNGCTALFYSVTLGHADCSTLLLKYGANPNRQDRKGRTPAHCGAAKGQLETIKILSQYGANIWMRNIRGDLPLHEAVQSGRRDLVRWLLDQLPVAVNAGNSNGRTALHIAAVNNNVEMCKILMDLSANVNPLMRNSKSQLMSPLDAALQRGNHGCAKYLQLHGALPATKLLEKHGINRAFLASVETRNRMPVPEMKIRSPFDHHDSLRNNGVTAYSAQPNRHIESSAQTDQRAYSQIDQEIQANQSDFPHQLTGARSPTTHQKVVSVEVHRSVDNGGITEARIERTTYRDPNFRQTSPPFEAAANVNGRNEGVSESGRDRGLSAELDAQDDALLGHERESGPFPLKHSAQQTSFININAEIEKMAPGKTKRNEGRHKVEFESVKGDGNESEGDMPNDSLTDQNEADGMYPRVSIVGHQRGRRAKSENALRRRVNRELRQVGREYKQRSYSEPRSKVNYVRIGSNGDTEPYYLKEDRVLTIEINENEMPPIIPNVIRQKNQNQMAKLKSGNVSAAEMAIISPNSSVRSNESNTTVQKDSGFSDYIEMIRSARETKGGEISSEGSTETLAPQNHERFWTSDSAADVVDFSRRRRTKRRPFKSEDFLDPKSKLNEQNSDIVTEYKNAGPRVAERLQKERIGVVNLNNVKSKIDTGFYGRRATTIPSRERARVIKVIRPASESTKYTNTETIAQEVQQSLRKFELERKLFQELQDLKRQQIRSGRANETFMVKRLVDKFRKEVLGPGMKDFDPPYTYRNFERYLYDVLRQLSTSNHGKVPKLKPVEEPGLKSTFIRETEGMSPTQCVIRTYKCTHASEAYAGYPASLESVFHNKHYTKLPAIPNNVNSDKSPESLKSSGLKSVLLTPASDSLNGGVTPSKTSPSRFPKTELHEKRTIASLHKMSASKSEGPREVLPKKRPPQPFRVKNKDPNATDTGKSEKEKLRTRYPKRGENGWISSTKVSPKFAKPCRLAPKSSKNSKESGDSDNKDSKVQIRRDRRDSTGDEADNVIEKEATVVLQDILAKVVNDVGSGRPVCFSKKEEYEEQPILPNDQVTSPKRNDGQNQDLPSPKEICDSFKKEETPLRDTSNTKKEHSKIKDATSPKRETSKSTDVSFPKESSKLNGSSSPKTEPMKQNDARSPKKELSKQNNSDSPKTVPSKIDDDRSPKKQSSKPNSSDSPKTKPDKIDDVNSPKKDSSKPNSSDSPKTEPSKINDANSPKKESSKPNSSDSPKMEPSKINDANSPKKESSKPNSSSSPRKEKAKTNDASSPKKEQTPKKNLTNTVSNDKDKPRSSELEHRKRSSSGKTRKQEPHDGEGSPTTKKSPEKMKTSSFEHPVLSSITTEFTSPLRFMKGFENKVQGNETSETEEILNIETPTDKYKETEGPPLLTSSQVKASNLQTQLGNGVPKTVTPRPKSSKIGYSGKPNNNQPRRNSEVLPLDRVKLTASKEQYANVELPTVILEAVRENLNEDAKPDDLVTVEVSSEGQEATKMTKTLTVQELLEATHSGKIKISSGKDSKRTINEPFTFEIKHGKEKNIYKLPSEKLIGDKKWQVTFVIGRRDYNKKPTVIN